MRKIGLTGLICIGYLASCVLVFAQNNKPNHLTISYPSISGAQAVLWVAKETGIFRKNGLDVDLVYIAGGPRSMAALLSGQLQVIGTGGNALVAANLGGAKDTVLIATTYNTLVFSLMTRENLKEPKDLQNKSLGVTGLGSLSDFTLRTLVRKWGLNPTQDVVIRPMGGYPEILSGMQSGMLDGGVFSPPGNLTLYRSATGNSPMPALWASNMPAHVMRRRALSFETTGRPWRNSYVPSPNPSTALKQTRQALSKLCSNT